MKNTDRHGFTLIELSLVLVIIGLLVGSVLAGKTLIQAAQIRSTISALNAIDAAISTFQTKYNSIPGDTDKATQLFDGITYNGDGNGVIEEPASNAPLEGLNIWHHLSMANLIDGTFQSFADYGSFDSFACLSGIPCSPKTPMGYVWLGMMRDSPGKQVFSLATLPSYQIGSATITRAGACDYGVTTLPCFLNPANAFAIDVKLDDGKPLTGQVIAAGGSGYCSFDSDISVYDTTSNSKKACYLAIRSQSLR